MVDFGGQGPLYITIIANSRNSLQVQDLKEPYSYIYIYIYIYIYNGFLKMGDRALDVIIYI